MAQRFCRQCPNCKSKKGFTVNYVLGGSHEMTFDFKGNLNLEKREGTDKLDRWAECLNCKKTIEVEKLEINF